MPSPLSHTGRAIAVVFAASPSRLQTSEPVPLGTACHPSLTLVQGWLRGPLRRALGTSHTHTPKCAILCARPPVRGQKQGRSSVLRGRRCPCQLDPAALREAPRGRHGWTQFQEGKGFRSTPADLELPARRALCEIPGLPHKVPHTGGLQTAEICSLPVLGPEV